MKLIETEWNGMKLIKTEWNGMKVNSTELKEIPLCSNLFHFILFQLFSLLFISFNSISFCFNPSYSFSFYTFFQYFDFAFFFLLSSLICFSACCELHQKLEPSFSGSLNGSRNSSWGHKIVNAWSFTRDTLNR